MIIKKEVSPDEFCLMLFAKKEEKERCEIDYDFLRERFDDLEDLKVTLNLFTLPKILAERCDNDFSGFKGFINLGAEYNCRFVYKYCSLRIGLGGNKQGFFEPSSLPQ